MMQKAENSLNLMKVYGIQISIHHTWVIVFLLVAWSLADGYYPQKILNLDSFSYWIMGVLSSLLLFVCVLLHELSHSLVAIRNGMKIKEITLFIFGGVARIIGEPQNAWTEFKIALAGPICSFFLGIFFFLSEKLLNFLGMHPAVILVLSYLALINMILAAFNLVPGFPLDGGRLLRAFFWMRTKDFSFATRIATKSGKTVAFIMIAFGAFQIITGSVVGGIWFILIGLFLQFAAQGGTQQMLLRENLKGITVREAMKSPAIAVDGDLELDQFVEQYFLPYQYQDFPVVVDSKVVGMINSSRVERIAKNRWTVTRVSEIMTSLNANLILDPDEDVIDAYNRMTEEQKGKLPVVKDGTLVGIITRKDILRLMKVRSSINPAKP
jgi:Zn-dependent protease